MLLFYLGFYMPSRAGVDFHKELRPYWSDCTITLTVGVCALFEQFLLIVNLHSFLMCTSAFNSGETSHQFNNELEGIQLNYRCMC